MRVALSRGLCFFGAVVILSGLISPQPASAIDTEIYYNDFDAPASFWPSVSGGFSGYTNTQSAEGFAGYGVTGNIVSGNVLHNPTGNNFTNTPSQKTTLILNGLEPHSGVKLRFLAGIIDTWDGEPWDYFNVAVDNVIVFRESFRNPLTPETSQSYNPAPGATIVKDENHFFEASLDSLYDMGFEPAFNTIAHSASTLRIDWWADGQNWNRPANESWFIENVRVTLSGHSGVPEPTAAFAVAALACPLCICRRSRRRAPRAPR